MDDLTPEQAALLTAQEVREEIRGELHEGNTRMNDLHKKIDEVQKSVEKLTRSLDVFFMIWNAGDGFVKVVKWFGVLIKWLVVTGGAIAAIAGGIWAIFHMGANK